MELMKFGLAVYAHDLEDVVDPICFSEAHKV